MTYTEDVVRDFQRYQLTIYNSINTLEALDGHNLCPPLPAYVDNLIEFIKVSELELEMPVGVEIMG